MPEAIAGQRIQFQESQNYFPPKAMNKMITQAEDFLQRPTQVAAELSYHAIWVRSRDLCKTRQDENITVFKRSLVHGLKQSTGKEDEQHESCNSRFLCSVPR